jgi:hypothetical protein
MRIFTYLIKISLLSQIMIKKRPDTYEIALVNVGA